MANCVLGNFERKVQFLKGFGFLLYNVYYISILYFYFVADLQTSFLAKRADRVNKD